MYKGERMKLCKQKLLNVCDVKCNGLLGRWGSDDIKSKLRKATSGDYLCIYSGDFVGVVDTDE